MRCVLHESEKGKGRLGTVGGEPNCNTFYLVEWKACDVEVAMKETGGGGREWRPVLCLVWQSEKPCSTSSAARSKRSVRSYGESDDNGDGASREVRRRGCIDVGDGERKSRHKFAPPKGGGGTCLPPREEGADASEMKTVPLRASE